MTFAEAQLQQNKVGGRLTSDDAVPHERPDGCVHAAAGGADVDDGQVQPGLGVEDGRLLRSIPGMSDFFVL